MTITRCDKCNAETEKFFPYIEITESSEDGDIYTLFAPGNLCLKCKRSLKAIVAKWLKS